MTQASPTKRMRLTANVLCNPNISEVKKNRLENKMAYLKTLPNTARFQKGAKQQGEGGWAIC